ncbi:MAG: hypothetical protein FWF76_05790 [Oscillospiraceae bacterium]|nr:hypothetical protein [Oscillospiraceae bacterium]
MIKKTDIAKKTLKIMLYVLPIVFIFAFVWLYNSFVFITTASYSGSIGIIDFPLSYVPYNVVYYSQDGSSFISENETHGDSLIDFLRDYNFRGTIYYFPAKNDDGIITTENIICGLEWLISNEITRINISLSSALRNDELQEFINNNPEIVIYASYNNQLNTLDFPAMYENVIGSGSDSRIQYKDIDRHYRTNKIVMTNRNGINRFAGNSFLSLVTMLNAE